MTTEQSGNWPKIEDGLPIFLFLLFLPHIQRIHCPVVSFEITSDLCDTVSVYIKQHTSDTMEVLHNWGMSQSE